MTRRHAAQFPLLATHRLNMPAGVRFIESILGRVRAVAPDAAQVLLQVFATLIVLGLDPLAAALTGVVAAFCGMFQHWNLHTPRWSAPEFTRLLAQTLGTG